MEGVRSMSEGSSGGGVGGDVTHRREARKATGMYAILHARGLVDWRWYDAGHERRVKLGALPTEAAIQPKSSDEQTVLFLFPLPFRVSLSSKQ